MSKINILIVEDEFIISNDIATSLEDCGYNIAGIAENIDEAIEILKSKNVNMVLLDINLNQAVDGIQIAHIINSEYSIPFIFVTAFTDTDTIERVKHTKPFGYVTKPFNDIDLKITIDLALNRFNTINEKKSEKKNVQNDEIIFIKTKKGLEKINISNIRWIEAYDYYSFIRLEKEKILATITLKALEEKINSNSFIKVHRKYVVNLNFIEKFVGNNIEIANELIPISRSHKEKLLEKLTLIN